MENKLKAVLVKINNSEAMRSFKQAGGRLGYLSYTFDEMLSDSPFNGHQYVQGCLEALRSMALLRETNPRTLYSDNMLRQISCATEMMKALADAGVQRTFPPMAGGRRATTPHYWLRTSEQQVKSPCWPA
jgi:hypothetical protein